MKPVSTLLTTLALATLFPLGVIAADAPAKGADTKAETTKTTQAGNTAESSKTDGGKADASRADAAKAGCEQPTTSRIRRKAEDCPKDMQPTRRYSKEDLDSTGQMDTAEALKRLDPRLH